VTWGTPVPSFVFLGLLVFELEQMYATSDRRTTDADHRLMPPPTGRGHNNFPENQLTKFRAFRASGRESVSIDDKRVPRGDWRDTRLWRYVA